MYIDYKTRKIAVDETINVEDDIEVTRVFFECKNQVTENCKLSEMQLFINYKNGINKDIYIVTDVKVDGDTISFSWLLGENATKYRGYTHFIVCAKDVDENGIVLKEWNTNLACFKVNKGLKASSSISESERDIIAQLKHLIDTEKVELLTLDTIDTFYEEEVPSPYIVEQEQVLHNFTYDGPYEINSYEDLVKAFKYLEKNTDLLRYEFEEINVTVNGEKKSLIDSKKVCYISYLANSVKDSGEFSGQDLVDFISALKNGTEIPDYAFQSMSNDSSIIYLSTQDSGEELYAVYSAADDLLYANTQNEITESLGANIQIFSDLEIKGQIYVEHYEDSIRYLYDNGYYTSKEYNSSGMLIDIGEYPYLYMNMSGIFFGTSGNPNYSILSVDRSLGLYFLDNFITEDLTDNPELRSKFKLNFNSSDVTGTLLKFQTTFLGNIYTEHWSSNPNYRSFLGWEKVYESVFEDLNYIINESDYAKYDYMVIVYPTKSGYMPSGSAYLEYQDENSTVKSFLYYSGDAAFKRVNYINNNDAFLRVGSEYIYPSGSGSTAYASSGFETLPTGLFVRSIRYYSSNNKGTKIEIYRKRCC